MGSRTQIVCLCEGSKGSSIDEVFINRLIRSIDPPWLRPWGGNNTVRLKSCGGRNALMEELPKELRRCMAAGGHTTLMVWADCDDTSANGDELKVEFWKEAERQGISRGEFDQVVLIFAKDRLENWIEFLLKGNTDEAIAAPRVKHNRDVADAAKKLAEFCKSGRPIAGIPPSLRWSCGNWRALVKRMKRTDQIPE